MGQLIEILILAFVAGIIIFKYVSILGQKTGFEKSKDQENPIDNKEKNEDYKDFSQLSPEENLIGPGLRKVYAQLCSLDRKFSLEHFLTGASRAFEMIVLAYAKGDLQNLKRFLSSEIYEDFRQAIDEREQNKETLETQIVSLEAPEITDMRIQGTQARITIRFTSEQRHLRRNNQGEIIEGNIKQSEQIIDVWTFEKDLKSQDSLWILVQTDQ